MDPCSYADDEETLVSHCEQVHHYDKPYLSVTLRCSLCDSLHLFTLLVLCQSGVVTAISDFNSSSFMAIS